MKTTRKLNDKIYNLEYKTFRIDDLMFNPYNTRIYDLIKSNKDLMSFEQTNDINSLKSFQGIIYDRLKLNFNKGENKSIVESIRKDNVQEKMIILSNGLLLSGNNRLSIIKKLQEMGEWLHGDKIEVWVLEGDLSKEEILLIELEIQNVQSKQLQYDVINNIRRAKQLLDDGVDSKRALELTNQTNYSVSYIQEFNKAINDISLFYKVSDIFEYTFNSKIFSMMDAYIAISSSSKVRSKIKIRKMIKDIFFTVMFISNIQVLNLRYIINTSLKMGQGDSEVWISELHKKTNDRYEEINNEFIEFISKSKENNLEKFIEDNKSKIEIINENYRVDLENMRSNLRSSIDQSAKIKKASRKIDIELRYIERNEQSISEAKELIKKLEEWIAEV